MTVLNWHEGKPDLSGVDTTNRELVTAWLQRNSFVESDFPAPKLLKQKQALGVSVTLILPTRNVGATFPRVLAQVSRLAGPKGRLIDQVLVVDAASTDGTVDAALEAGAEVWDEADLAPECGVVLGKGDAMWRSLEKARGDIVVFADTDTVAFESSAVRGVLGPLITDPQIHFVKAAFTRPFATATGVLPNEGGRVTELTARPLLNLFFPQLAGFAQPLAGEFACRREVIEHVPFVTGYGVESSLLIDIWRQVGLDAMAQVYVGSRQNQHQSLRDLSRMSFAVARTILDRAISSGALAVNTPLAFAGVVPGHRAYLHAEATPEGVVLRESDESLEERPRRDSVGEQQDEPCVTTRQIG